MAIDRVKRVTLMVPTYSGKPLVSRLYQLGVVHVSDVFSENSATHTTLKKHHATTHIREDDCRKLEFVVPTLGALLATERSFIEGLFPAPVYVKKDELAEIVSSLEIDGIYSECKALCLERDTVERGLKDVQREKDSLKELLGLPWTLSELNGICSVSVRLGLFSKGNWSKFTLNRQARELLAWQDVSVSGARWKRVLVAYLPGGRDGNEEDGAAELLNILGFKDVAIPKLPGRAEEETAELEKRRRALAERLAALRSRLSELAHLHHRKATALLGYLESEKERRDLETHFARSKKLLLVTGYVKEKDVHILEETLGAEYPEHATVYDEPSSGEDVPVSLTLNPLFRPVQLITRMFGLPNYFSFDPTPYIVLNFLLFFGICFSDVIYGVMLVGLSCYMMKRYRQNPGLRNFFCLFLYAGVSTILCGALMGGWAGDLYKPEYLGAGNVLLHVKERVAVFDPLNNLLVALVLVLGLGIINQFYALSLRMYREYHMGRPWDALMDGGLWMVFLSGLVILVGHVFIVVPPDVIVAGKAAAVVGAAGLVLTQGRMHKGIAARLITGLISVYGIMGTYGATAFVSDILSYSRLLALGLTTSIIAMSFNIIATLAGSAGTFFFVLALVVGHTLNFAICIIGSFVHPARLIMLEFFGRFYEAGATRFRPFGFHSERVQIIE
jgi:V/A-type H+-transporting ATPase subunit I